MFNKCIRLLQRKARVVCLLKFYFSCSTQEQPFQLSKYSLGSYHKAQHTHSITLTILTALTASQEAHIFLNKQGAASSSSNNNSFNNKIKYKAGYYLVHV